MSNGVVAVLAAKVPASSDPSVQSFQKHLESAELAELTSASKALKYYKKSVKELSKTDVSSDAQLASILNDVKARITSLESKQPSEKQGDLLDSQSSTSKRSSSPSSNKLKSTSATPASSSSAAPIASSSSAPANNIPPRVRKSSRNSGSASGVTGTPSGSMTSLTASASEGGSAANGKKSSHSGSKSKDKESAKRNSKRVGVRFQEQKKFYFYDEEASPEITSKVAAGFTSIPGVNHASYEPLVRELIHLMLIPATTSKAPFTEEQIGEYIQAAFSLDDDTWSALLQEERSAWNIYAFIKSLITRQNNLSSHPFYATASFRSEEEAASWQSLEKQRLGRLIDRLKVLAPDYDEKCPPRNTPSRSKSKSGMDDSTSTNTSSRSRSASASKVIKGPRRKDTAAVLAGTPAAAASSLGNSSHLESDDSELGTAITPAAAAAAASSSKPTSVKKKPSKAAVVAVDPALDSSDSKDATTSESVSTEITSGPWSGRGPRVAIRPLQFSGDDTDSNEADPYSTPAGSARLPQTPMADSNEQHYSGSDPGVTPRSARDTDDSLEDDDGADGSQSQKGKSLPRGAIAVSRKPRNGSTGRSGAGEASHMDSAAKLKAIVDMDLENTAEDEQAEFAEPINHGIGESTEESKNEVSTAPSPFEILFRTFVHHEQTDLRREEKRIEKIIPLLDQAHEAISSQFSLDRHVNMFDALPTLNADAFISGFSGTNFFLTQPDTTFNTGFSSPTSSSTSKKSSSSSKKSKKKDQEKSNGEYPWKVPCWDPAGEMEVLLFGINPIGRWLLGEYAILWGYSPLYQNLVQLNHVVAFLMPSADMLLMLYVLMTRVLDLLQAEEVEPIPSALETYYFAQLMRDLNRDAESNFYNMFGQFSYEDLAALKMLLNILSLIYECNEFLGEAPPKTYKAYLEQALEESVRNYYTEVLADAEEPRESSGDPVGTNPTSAVRKRQRSERRTTANQLLAACDALGELLANLDTFQALFQGLSKPIFDICCKAYIRQLFSDTSLFVIKMARTQPVSRALALASGIIKINELCLEHSSKSDLVEPLPVEKLFGAFLYDWLYQTEVSMKEWANTTCKIDRWIPVDLAKGKMWSACSWDLYKLVVSHIPFVLDNETLFALTVQAEEDDLKQGIVNAQNAPWASANGTGANGKASLSGKVSHAAIGYTAESISERKKTYFYQYSLAVSRLLRDFIENVYNLFVEEFPGDLHSDLHDLYIRDYYNMTTGGSGLHMTYKKKKKSIFGWLTGRRSKSDVGDDPTRHASLSTSSSQPKLGKKKSMGALSAATSSQPSNKKGATATAADADENDYGDDGNEGGYNSAPSSGGYQSGAIVNDDDPNRELIINVWSMIAFDPKRVLKMRKLRKRIDIKQSMCTKLNDLDALRAFFDRLLQSEPLFQLAANPAFVLMHKVFRTFLHMIIYIINMHLDTEMEHIYKKCGKKPSSSVFEAHALFINNFTEQLALMKDNLRNNIFKRVLLRLWKVVQEDMAELLAPEDEDGKSRPAPTALQIAALEALLDSIRPVLSGYGMSTNHINTKIAELLGPHKESLASGDLEKAKAIYEAERDKYNHKEKRKGSGLANSSAGVLPIHIGVSPAVGDGPHRSLSSPALSASSETSSRKPKRDGSKESLRIDRIDGSDSARGRSPGDRAAPSASGAPRRLPLVKDNSSNSISSSSAAPQTPVSAHSTATTSTASGAKRSSGQVGGGADSSGGGSRARAHELSHQESASHFVHEETPLTESSEEADAYANIKSRITTARSGGSDSSSNSGQDSSGSSSESESESSKDKEPTPPPSKPPKKPAKPTTKPVVPPKGTKKADKTEKA